MYARTNTARFRSPVATRVTKCPAQHTDRQLLLQPPRQNARVPRDTIEMVILGLKKVQGLHFDRSAVYL